MADPQEPWLVFFDCWDHATRGIPRISPSPDRPGERSAAFLVVDEARQAVLQHILDHTDWTAEAAERLASCLALEVVIWAYLDGIDRDRLRVRLRSCQTRITPSAQSAPHEAESGKVRPVRLPDSYYLPRLDANGSEIRDALPWPEGLEYVSDGTRYGIRLREGDIRWFEDAPTSVSDPLRDDFHGLDLDPIVAGLKEYLARRQPLPLELAEDVAALEAVLIQRRRTGAESDPSE